MQTFKRWPDYRKNLTNRLEILIMREHVLKLLSTEFADVDFTSSDTLVDDGILDSLILVELISTLSMEYGITIPYEEIIPDNFNSLDAIASLVERLRG